MLNRKLSKLSLAAAVLFLTAASVRSDDNSMYNDSASKEIIKAVSLKKISAYSAHTFDSTGLCTCIDETETSSLVAAPRISLNPKAKKFVTDYLKKNNNGLVEIKDRSIDYFGMMDKVFCSYDLPLELKYLSIVESRLKHRAVSHAGAAGLWQLMPATAKQMGLKITRRYDERMLRNKSTQAAAKYLNILHNEFGDWLLAMAAYNSGPGSVYKAIKRSGSKNFWTLQRFLPAETRDYVKRYISVHYYFEGHGSITTMTKDEIKKHIQLADAFNEKIKQEEETAAGSSNNNIANEPVISGLDKK